VGCDAGVYSLRYAGIDAMAIDEDKRHDVLDDAVIVIAEGELECSRSDPRVREPFERGGRLWHLSVGGACG
jgi:hypothetical protein